MTNFAALTSKNHEPSPVSQIIPRSVLQINTKPSKTNTNSNAQSSTSISVTQKDTNNGSTDMNTAGAIETSHIQPTQTFYKRNLIGECIPLEISQDSNDDSPSDFFFVDKTTAQNQVGNDYYMDDGSYQRRKNILIHREKVLHEKKSERTADLLVNELVLKTPMYRTLVTSNIHKLNNKNGKKSKKQSDGTTDKGGKGKDNGKSTSSKDAKRGDSTKASEDAKKKDHSDVGKGENVEDNDDSENDDDEDEDLDTHTLFSQPEQLLPKLRLSQQKRVYLEQQRRYQEATIPHKFHPIQLQDWNAEINWEGCSSPSHHTTKQIGTTSVTRVISPSHSDNNQAPPLDPYDILSQTRNPELDALNFASSNSLSMSMDMQIMWEGANTHSSTLQPAKLILHESKAGSSIAHLALPTKRPIPFHQSLPYHKRCQLMRISGKKSSSDSFMMHSEQNKEFEQKQKKRSLLENEKKQRVSLALGALDLGGGKGRTITSSLMGPGGTERTGRPSRHENSSSTHDAENVEQLELVYNHTLVKADPRIPELRQFHRPRLPKFIVNLNHPWKVQLRIFPDLSTTTRKSSSAGGLIGSYMSGMKSDIHNNIRSASDLSATEGDLVLLEYCEERPPIQLSKGMGSKIVNYYRGEKTHCPISKGGGDRPTRKRAAQVTNTETTNSGKAEKPPKLVGPESAEGMSWIDLIGMKLNPKKNGASQALDKENMKEKDKPAVDVLPEGISELLHPKVHGPFIGEVEQCVTQSGLICNLFAAPVFRHDPEITDFLMILGKKPNKIKHSDGTNITNPLSVILRPLPTSTYCVGQTEPRVKVSAPNATIEKDFLKAFVTFQIAKALEIQQRKDMRGLKLDDIKEWIFPNTPHLTNYIRQRLKQVANHDTKTQMWTTKRIGEDDYPGVEMLGRNFSPEGVAAYEAARAAIQRLHDLGIRDLDLGSSTVSNVGAAMIYLNAGVAAARERKTKMTKMRDYAKRDKEISEKMLAYFDKAVSKLEDDLKRKIHMQGVARYIYEELQLTPWHLTSEFIDVHKHTQGTAMMKLTGLGDPSGRSEAYNFLREVDAKPNKETGNSDGALNAQIKKITGTENDLRRLTMKQMASLLLSYGLPQKEIDTLRRWDRVHVIRDVSTRGDGNQDGLEKSKFARGEKMKLSDQKRMYRERIQTIWRQQIAALTSDAGVFDAATDKKETEADLDDDDFDLDLDDEDEDNFFSSLASEIVDERKAKGVIQSSGASAEDTEDATMLMKWQRQREEERKAQERLESARGEVKPAPTGAKTYDVNRKVIRRKITKTFADGQQKTTFKFIVLQHEVDKANAKKKKEQQDSTLKLDKKHEKMSKSKQHKSTHKKHSHIFTRDESKRVGHAMFEDEDDVKRDRKKTNIKLQVRSNTRVVTTKKKNRSHLGPKALPKSSSKKSMTKEQKLKEKKKEKNRKKRMKELEESDMYSLASQKRGTSNRRERGATRDRKPHVMMSQRLEKIRSEVESRELSRPFHRPVNRQQIPSYYEIIKDPIDLMTIRDKNARYEYRTTEAFLKEFKLMKNNAVRFNGEESHLAEEGINIYKFVKETVEANRDDFQKLEVAVQDQLNGSNRRKKKQSKPEKKKESDDISVGATTNVMLDGFETTVNLGDINANFDSDSD